MPRIVDWPLWNKAFRVMENRKKAYQLTFGSSPGRVVLRDLGPFCRLMQSSWHDNQRTADRLQGRQDVILRIMAHMNLSEDQLMALYADMQKPLEERING
jgi:hypothetical protein